MNNDGRGTSMSDDDQTQTGQDTQYQQDDTSSSTGSKGGSTGSGQGFAGMDPDEQKDIASKGGQNSPTQFKPDDERTEEAARKGGQH